MRVATFKWTNHSTAKSKTFTLYNKSIYNLNIFHVNDNYTIYKNNLQSLSISVINTLNWNGLSCVISPQPIILLQIEYYHKVPSNNVIFEQKLGLE